METSTEFNNIPEGYLVRRKKSVLLFFLTVYAFCALFLLLRFGFINYIGNRLSITLIGFIIFIGNYASISFMHNAKRFYKKMPVPNYNDISAVTLKEKILYPITIVITGYFSIVPVICLVTTLVSIYYNVETFNKPFLMITNNGK